MNLAAFKRTLSQPAPPKHVAPALVALWWAAKGDWERAHKLVMDCEGLDDAGGEAAWVHAYLHRVEGDLDNANYWYRAARRPPAAGALQAEWDAIVTALLARDS